MMVDASLPVCVRVCVCVCVCACVRACVHARVMTEASIPALDASCSPLCARARPLPPGAGRSAIRTPNLWLRSCPTSMQWLIASCLDQPVVRDADTCTHMARVFCGNRLCMPTCTHAHRALEDQPLKIGCFDPDAIFAQQARDRYSLPRLRSKHHPTTTA